MRDVCKVLRTYIACFKMESNYSSFYFLVSCENTNQPQLSKVVHVSSSVENHIMIDNGHCRMADATLATKWFSAMYCIIPYRFFPEIC